MTANTALSSTTTTTTISGGSNHHHSSSMTGTHHNNHHLVITGSSLLSSSSTTSSSSGRCGPSLIKYRNLRFLITDKPTDATLNQYVEELQRRNVTDVVRVCEATYSPKRLEQAGIKCHDWAFDDGTPPPQKIIDQWLELIIERFKDCPIPPSSSSSSSSRSDRKVSSATTNLTPAQINGSNSVEGSPGSTAAANIDSQLPCIAVHCVAGLGRAPVLVAIALIEAGLKYIDAVEMIRAARRGAINAKQLDYLSEYKPKKVLMFTNRSSSKRKYCCII
ncbi:protein-tyrosine phosphatase 4A family member PRL-1 isoform X2 [Dermatophagoides farinae]|uniref:Protein tyrosine phosphatase type IVA 1 n=1 Tax=Dermatophagoides farinae TaxID=6954 RepID=A0A922HWL3_DERFA|nr:protein tyrosine phosphatase type IVA 3-like isoform X2 [Dermatophagoides farinae]KAH9511053.1 Protein tyrosine phosphatase type IVA 1 [Dermatophagoides farinae]